MHGYQKRLDLWLRRLSDLSGPLLDPQAPDHSFRGEEANLTLREFQLLELLLDHPYRYFTVARS